MGPWKDCQYLRRREGEYVQDEGVKESTYTRYRLIVCPVQPLIIYQGTFAESVEREGTWSVLACEHVGITYTDDKGWMERCASTEARPVGAGGPPRQYG